MPKLLFCHTNKIWPNALKSQLIAIYLIISSGADRKFKFKTWN